MKHRAIPQQQPDIEIVFTYEEAKRLGDYLHRTFYGMTIPHLPVVESALREALKDHIND
jgi:hypothetical protein